MEYSSPIAPSRPDGGVKEPEAKEAAKSEEEEEQPVVEPEDEEGLHAVGLHEKEWLKRTAARDLGCERCWLRLSSVKTIQGAVLHVAQLSNHLAVALGAGEGHQNGCSRFEVYSFTLVTGPILLHFLQHCFYLLCTFSPIFSFYV